MPNKHLVKSPNWVDIFKNTIEVPSSFLKVPAAATASQKPFKTKGLQILLKYAPNALVVPISINNSWKLLKYGKFPMGLGTHMTFDVHPPIENSGKPEELIEKVEASIKAEIKI